MKKIYRTVVYAFHSTSNELCCSVISTVLRPSLTKVTLQWKHIYKPDYHNISSLDEVHKFGFSMAFQVRLDFNIQFGFSFLTQILLHRLTIASYEFLNAVVDFFKPQHWQTCKPDLKILPMFCCSETKISMLLQSCAVNHIINATCIKTRSMCPICVGFFQ